ncbi:MAG: transcription elongation factor GreA [bacterium]
MRPAVYLTRAGHTRFLKELKELKGPKRKKIAEMIAIARAHGDLRENAEYEAAREAQAFNEKRIAELNDILSRVKIIEDENIPNDKVYIGSKVTLLDLDTDEEVTYALLGEHESDITKKIISTTSPIGKSMLGKEEGDEVTVVAPGGRKNYEIIEISRYV